MEKKPHSFMEAAVEFGAQLESFEVVSPLPDSHRRLVELARKNIAWSWNQKLLNALEDLDPKGWQAADHNFLRFVETLSLESWAQVQQDESFQAILREATAQLEDLQAQPVPQDIAYFCMEYGLATCLRLYSGGLGVLAGDHLKTASDMRIPLCAVGLAYRHGYFEQRLDKSGQQIAERPDNDFLQMPLEPVLDQGGQRFKFKVPFPGREVTLQAWKVGVGAVSLYLLDADCDENSPEDRLLTDHLYGGDSHHRLQQEILLGVGGYWLLKGLGIEPKVFHLNEGHAAFLIWARMNDLMQSRKLEFFEALEYIYQTNIFTTHTPVPAGHDVFGDDLIRPYLETYAPALRASLEQMSHLGKLSSDRMETCFSMTDLALRGSSFVNGVSQIHGQVAREMFQSVYPGFDVSEVPVRGITNGVHLGTWLAQEWQEFYAREIGVDWNKTNPGPALEASLSKLPDREIWETHLRLKRRLIKSVREHITSTYGRRGESPASLASALIHLNERALFIGFARRFAPYKRATLLFQHIERLLSLVQGGWPIVILYAGKAHPNDKQGQDFIRQIIEISRRPDLQGRVVFIENYELDVARHLVQGCDIWLNTPTRPLEASGTSGMKAGINGCLNMSVDDGWWSECYNGRNGWLISDHRLNENIEFQLHYDSAQIYSLLESEVVPLYFDRGEDGVPTGWVQRMRESMLTTTWAFSTSRMLDDYRSIFLQPALENAEELSRQQHEPVRALASLKKRFFENWPQVKVESMEVQGLEQGRPLMAGSPVSVKAKLRHPGLRAQDLLLQAIVARPEVTVARATMPQAEATGFQAVHLDLVEDHEGSSQWAGSFSVSQTGEFSLGVRAIPCMETQSARTRVFMQLSKWY